jgi:hypothetical protein
MIRALTISLALAATACSHSTASAGNDGDEAGYPGCPGDLEAGAPCTVGAPECFSCTSGDGFYCGCETDSGVEGPDAAIWVCLGTGYTCQ